MVFGIKPVGCDGTGSVGTMKTMHVDRIARCFTQDLHDFVDAQKARSHRKTVELHAKFFGAFLDFGRELVQADDGRNAEGLKLGEIVFVGHRANKEGVYISEVAGQSLGIRHET